MNENDLLSVNEYAKILRLSRAGFYKLLNENKIPAPFAIGGRRYIRRSKVEAFIAEQEALAA